MLKSFQLYGCKVKCDKACVHHAELKVRMETGPAFLPLLRAPYPLQDSFKEQQFCSVLPFPWKTKPGDFIVFMSVKT